MRKKIVGTDYEIDIHGDVYNAKNGKKLSQWPNKKGYMRVGIRIDGRQEDRKVHRLVASAFIPNPDNLQTVDHIDGNVKNNHASNLQWLHISDNMSKSGMKNHDGSLAREVLRLFSRGERRPDIVRSLNVCRFFVRDVIKGRIYRAETNVFL